MCRAAEAVRVVAWQLPIGIRRVMPIAIEGVKRVLAFFVFVTAASCGKRALKLFELGRKLQMQSTNGRQCSIVERPSRILWFRYRRRLHLTARRLSRYQIVRPARIRFAHIPFLQGLHHTPDLP